MTSAGVMRFASRRVANSCAMVSSGFGTAPCARTTSSRCARVASARSSARCSPSARNSPAGADLSAAAMPRNATSSIVVTASRQLALRVSGRELHHPAQVLIREAAPVVADKLLGQGWHDFLAVLGRCPASTSVWIRWPILQNSKVSSALTAEAARWRAASISAECHPTVPSALLVKGGHLAPAHAVTSAGDFLAPVIALRRFATNSAASRTGLSSVWT